MEEESVQKDYKLVPWLNWDEWESIRKSIFSSSPESVEYALKRVACWKSRGCLPVAIEVTAAIIEVQQKDPFLRSCSATLDSTEMLSMAYSMAVVRLVNSLIEKSRKKTGPSIAKAAAAIGMPRMLIDIRHECSHRDLPSLPLVRLASTKALDWLKSYYWEPQRKAIPNIRKEIKSKLRKIILAAKKVDGSTPLQGAKDLGLIHGSKKLLSYAAGKFPSSKSGGPRKQLKKHVQDLCGLYSLYPSDTVTILLEFLLKASEFSRTHFPDNSVALDVNLNQGNTYFTITVDDCKLIMKKLSIKQPMLPLILLEEMLGKIASQDAEITDEGRSFHQLSQYEEGNYQIESYSALVLWLIDHLKNIMKLDRLRSKRDNRGHVNDVDSIQRTMKELLQKCILLSSPCNQHLLQASLLLAEMMGNQSISQKLKELPSLSIPILNFVDQQDDSNNLESILLQEADYIKQALEKFRVPRRFQAANKDIIMESYNDTTVVDENNMWNVAKSWSPCPIGMLPGGVGNLGVLPVLENHIDELKQNVTINGLNEDNFESNNKRESSWIADDLQKFICAKRLKTTVNFDHSDDGNAINKNTVERRLLIEGVTKMIMQEDELLAIQDSIQILV